MQGSDQRNPEDLPLSQIFAFLTSAPIFPGNLTLNACDSLVNTAAVCKSSAAPARHEWTQEKGEQRHMRGWSPPPKQRLHGRLVTPAASAELCRFGRRHKRRNEL